MAFPFVQVASAVVLVVGGAYVLSGVPETVRRTLAVATSDAVDPTNPQGAFGRVTGTARVDGGTVEAPFSGEGCLAYDCTVEQEGDDVLETNTVRTETEAVPFTLDVDGRTVRVVPVDATVELEQSTTVDVPGGEEPPDRIQAYNEQVGLSPQHTPVGDVVELSTGWDRAYHEGRVERGDEVTVVGDVRLPDRPDPGVDAVVDAGAPRFVVTDRDALRAALGVESSHLWLSALALAAVVIGLGMLVVALG